jgi:hypothetical protein
MLPISLAALATHCRAVLTGALLASTMLPATAAAGLERNYAETRVRASTAATENSAGQHRHQSLDLHRQNPNARLPPAQAIPYALNNPVNLVDRSGTAVVRADAATWPRFWKEVGNWLREKGVPASVVDTFLPDGMDPPGALGFGMVSQGAKTTARAAGRAAKKAARETAEAAIEGAPKALSKSQQKGIRSLEKQIAEQDALASV